MPAVYPKREAGPSVYFEHISSSILNPIKVHGYGYLVCTTPPAVLCQPFSNFTGVFVMV